MTNTLYYGDNLDILRRYIDRESVDQPAGPSRGPYEPPRAPNHSFLDAFKVMAPSGTHVDLPATTRRLQDYLRSLEEGTPEP